jgi:hypothetical protein
VRVYISGPMSGLPDLNFPAFHGAAKRLRAAGHDVVSPAEMDDPEDTTEHDWGWYLRRDLKALVDCEAVVVLPGWKDSKGARLETSVAAQLGMPLYSLDRPMELHFRDCDISERHTRVAAGGHCPCPCHKEEPMSNLSNEEPDPIPNNRRPSWELVIEDMEERNRTGIAKYGTPLQPMNGRDSLVDAYQEALDLVVYLRNEIEERRGA